MLAGKSASELLSIILYKDVFYKTVSMEKSPEYWAGWVLANTQWYLNVSFSRIFDVISLSEIISLYHPYHEANEMKTVEYIEKLFPRESQLKRIRQMVHLTQEQLAMLSGVKLRSIKAYEQGENDILKAQGETLLLLARGLHSSVEELLKKY